MKKIRMTDSEEIQVLKFHLMCQCIRDGIPLPTSLDEWWATAVLWNVSTEGEMPMHYLLGLPDTKSGRLLDDLFDAA